MNDIKSTIEQRNSKGEIAWRYRLKVTKCDVTGNWHAGYFAWDSDIPYGKWWTKGQDLESVLIELKNKTP